MARRETIIRFLIATLAMPMTTAGSQEAEDVQARQALAEHGAAFSQHMVRVRIQRSLEIKRVDGLALRTEILPEGFTTGLVVTREPLILVTASDVIRVPKLLSPRLSSRPPNLSERQYVLILKDGTTVETEVLGRVETLNMIKLRPKDPKNIPDELRWPIDLDGARRPIAGELLGMVAFSMPQRSPMTSTYTFRFPADRPDYARPVMTLASLGHLNSPVLAVDGSLTGILNLSPRDTTRELSPEDLVAGSAHDPLASVAAGRHAFLITGQELLIVLGDLIREHEREKEPVVPYALLGFRLQMRGDAPRVHSLIGSNSSTTDEPGVRTGDIVVGLAGTALKRLEEFDQILESSLERGARQLILELERNGERLEVVLLL